MQEELNAEAEASRRRSVVARPLDGTPGNKFNRALLQVKLVEGYDKIVPISAGRLLVVFLDESGFTFCFNVFHLFVLVFH